MTVKELLEKLKNAPEDAEVTIGYAHLGYRTTKDVEDVAFYERHNVVNLMTKGYK